MNYTNYFFAKCVNTTSLIDKSTRAESSAVVFTDSSTNHIHFVFQYDSLDTIFINDMRSQFYTYNVKIVSGKKSIIRSLLPATFSKHFFNSSFLVSFPVKNFESAITIFSLFIKFINAFSNNTSRFSTFPIFIYYNYTLIPIEYFYYFTTNYYSNFFFNNKIFLSAIITNFYNKHFMTFNSTFFKNGHN